MDLHPPALLPTRRCLGDLDQAYVHFDRVYAQMKTRMFKGEDPKYLDFYMTRSGKKKQR